MVDALAAPVTAPLWGPAVSLPDAAATFAPVALAFDAFVATAVVILLVARHGRRCAAGLRLGVEAARLWLHGAGPVMRGGTIGMPPRARGDGGARAGGSEEGFSTATCR